MSNLAQLIKARHQLTSQRELIDSKQASLIDNELRTRHATFELRQLEPNFADPETAAPRALRRRQLELLPENRRALTLEVQQLEEQIPTIAREVEELGTSQPSLWDATGFPVVLFPIRIETCFKTAARGSELLVRVYPDDLHLEATPAPLTASEEESGCAYWRSIWPMIGDARQLPTAIADAWQELVRKVEPNRATLIANRTRPSNAPENLATPVVAPDHEPRFERRASGSSDSETRAALMPDKWSVYGLKDGQLLFNVTGASIPKSLPVSALRRKARSEQGEEEVPRGWLVEFDKAVQVGMAVIVHLDDERPTIDQLFVLGISSEADPKISAKSIVEALRARAFRGALEFLAPRTPTNNTADSPSGWHSNGTQTVSPDELRLGFDPSSSQNAAILARALGIDGRDALGGVAGATDDWQTAAGTMIDALWPALTVDWDMIRRRDVNFDEGGFQGPGAAFDGANYQALRADAMAFVRSRGPLPTLRIGREPYGILPVSSLDAWATTSEDTIEALKVRMLRHLRPFWQAGLANVPRAQGRKDQDEALMAVLAQDAVSAGVAWRPAAQTVDNSPVPDNYDPAGPLTIIPDIPWNSTLLSKNLRDQCQEYKVPLVGNPKAISEYWTTRREIVAACLAAPPMDPATIETKIELHIRTHPGVDPPLTKSLLYALFRYGQLREGDETVGMDGIIGDPDQFWRPSAERQAQLLKGLERILPQDFELLTAETLDLFSHRLDAWITSLATRRLKNLRAAQPIGCHVGGYGWVESLKPADPAPSPPTTPPGFTGVQVREGDTYVLAPSLHHAASAAVLRAGFDSHSDENAFGVNLASGRARLARWIVDGVRNGQPLGVLLGYWFERGLHNLRKDELIDDIREQFPSPTVPDQDENDAAAAARLAIAARNVVDGLALYKAATGATELTLTPAQSGVLNILKTEVDSLVNGLTDLVDAVSDLVLAESVHQLVGGNPMRAGLAADTLGRGESLPSRFDMITSPRSGAGLTCSVAVLLPMIGPRSDLGWNIERPRARIAPQTEAWVANLLGASSSWRIVCDVTTNASSREIDCGLDELELCALDIVLELDARAPGTVSVLERRIVSHVGATTEAGARVTLAADDRSGQWRRLSDLVQRINGVLRAGRRLQASHLDPLHQPPDPVPGATAFAVRVAAATVSPSAAADTLRDAMRAVGAAAPEDRDKAAEDVALAAAVELAVRANSFLKSLADATAQLRTEHQTIIVAASPEARAAGARKVAVVLTRLADHGIANSHPLIAIESPADVELVVEQARLVLETIDSLDLPDGDIQIKDGVGIHTWTEEAIRIISGIVGERFPLASAFAPLQGGELAMSLGQQLALKGSGFPDIMCWLRRLARVRTAVSDFHDLMLDLEAREPTSTPLLKVIQAPREVGNANETWAAQARPIAAQRTAVLHTPIPLEDGVPLCGWLIDAWTERIPGLTSFTGTGVSEKSELAGLTFHYNQPDSRAPHALLLAVPPDPTKPWTEEMLLQVVRETLDLAKIRSMDHRDLPRLTPLVPVSFVVHGSTDKWPEEMDPEIL